MAPPAFEGHINYGIPIEPCRPREQQMTTDQGNTWRLRHSDVRWRTCQAGFPPFDKELEWFPGQLTPRVQESVVRLVAWRPFAQAALACCTGLTVSAGHGATPDRGHRRGQLCNVDRGGGNH